MSKKINIEFDGFWRETKKNHIPSISGIYCVNSCTYNQETKKVTLKKLIYIGESNNINHRINNHEKLNDWKKQLKYNEVLCFNVASTNEADRDRVEASLIYHHKPPVNVEYKNTNEFAGTIIYSSGKTGKIDSVVSV